MAIAKSQYRSRRINAAIDGGFKRIGRRPRKAEKDALKRELGKIWDAGINRPCFLCLETNLVPSKAAFCHDIALAAGGEHVAGNIFLGCGRCNRAMRTLSVAEYLALQKAVIEAIGEPKWRKVRAWLAGSRY
jgi:hypothetical protein